MVGDFRRIQDLVLVLLRWGIFGGLLYGMFEAPDSQVPLPLIGALGMYTLFLTIVFIGAWGGSTGFGHLQCVGDLGLVLATLVLAPNLITASYVALVAVGTLIGLRRFTWAQTAV